MGSEVKPLLKRHRKVGSMFNNPWGAEALNTYPNSCILYKTLGVAFSAAPQCCLAFATLAWLQLLTHYSLLLTSHSEVEHQLLKSSHLFPLGCLLRWHLSEHHLHAVLYANTATSVAPASHICCFPQSSFRLLTLFHVLVCCLSPPWNESSPLAVPDSSTFTPVLSAVPCTEWVFDKSLVDAWMDEGNP